jgi:ketosteroid isomerase-like protein
LRTAAESPVEGLLAEFTSRVNAQDWERLQELCSPGFEMVDHRGQGAGVIDLDELIAGYKKTWELSPDLRLDRRMIRTSGVDLAASITEFTGHLGAENGGPLALALGSVSLFRDGLLVRTELFEADDEAAMLARLEELATDSDPVRLAPGIPPDHPLIAVVRAQCSLFDVDDGRWEATLAPDFVAIDRRLVGWGERLDRDAVLETRATARAIAPDMRQTVEIIAVADDLLARVMSFRGHTTEGGGLMDIAFADVITFEDGRFASEEFFPPDDREAILARFDELLVERAATPVARLAAEWLRRHNAREWDGVRAMYADDVVHEDHRAVGRWQVDGADDVVAQLRDMTLVTPDMRARRDLLAEMGAVSAGRVTFAATYGGSPIETVLQATVIRNGRIARIEEFDPDDEDGLFARCEELRAGAESVRVGPGADPAAPCIDRVRALCAAFNARDWEAYRVLFADGYVGSDHRSVGRGEAMDAEHPVETAISAVAINPDVRMTVEVIAASGTVMAHIVRMRGHTAEGGGEIEVEFGTVLVVEDGRGTLGEMFDAEDREAILARFDELLVEQAPTSAERVTAEYLRRYNARDWDGLRAVFADDVVNADRRSIALWDYQGGDALVAALRESVPMTPDRRTRFELVAADGDVTAGRQIWTGTFEGGPIEIAIGQVLVVHDGRYTSIENFDPDDEDAMLARYEALRVAQEPDPVG